MPTPRSTGALFFALALVLTACGGGSSDDVVHPSPERDRSSTTSTSEAGGGTTPNDGGGACTELDEAAEQLNQVPLFLQLDTPDKVAAIKSGLIGTLDLDVFFRAMVTLHRLDGSTSPLGDPRDAIDAYERAAVEAKPLFAAAAPDQAAINAYQDSLGDPGAFLSYQTPISAALTEAGC